MNRNAKVLISSGLTIAVIAGIGRLAIKRIRDKQELIDSESGET